LSKEDIEWADLVVYMDRADKRALRQMKCKKKMVCLAKYVDKEEIPDPVNIPRGFELGAVCKLIKKAAIGLILSFTPKEERNGSTPTD
jgi:protein-tyrosine-phosphatase